MFWLPMNVPAEAVTSNDPEGANKRHKTQKGMKFLKRNEKYVSNELPKSTARMTFGLDMV